MNLATLATYFAYQTISAGFVVLYRHLTQTSVIEVLTPKYLRSDHYSTRGPTFSENNSPADQIFREFWSPGPKFSPDQNFCDRTMFELARSQAPALLFGAGCDFGNFEHAHRVIDFHLKHTHSLTTVRSQCPKATFVDKMVEIRRKLGLLMGVWCQHAFIILRTREGLLLGRGSRYPWATFIEHCTLSMFW